MSLHAPPAPHCSVCNSLSARALAPHTPVLRNNSILIALDDNSRSKDNSQGLQILLQRDTLAMTRLSRLLSNLILFAYILLTLVVDAARFLWLCLRSPTTLAAENLFLRKQLALY